MFEASKQNELETRTVAIKYELITLVSHRCHTGVQCHFLPLLSLVAAASLPQRLRLLLIEGESAGSCLSPSRKLAGRSMSAGLPNLPNKSQRRE